MSLDEAIRYYSRLADECRRKANIERYDYMDLKDLAAEHGQLADWLNELKVLREKIQTLLKKQEADKWIPVTERLPKKQTKVLVVDFGEVDTAYINSEGRWMDFYGDKLKDVTAWRLLPKPPYQEDKA